MDDIVNGFEAITWGTWEKIYEPGDTVIIATGTMVQTALEVYEKMKGMTSVAVINARFVKPLDKEMLLYCQKKYKNIISVEENVLRGGLGQVIGAYLKENNYAGSFHAFGLPDKFVTHGNRKILLDEIGLNAASIINYIEQIEDESAIGHGKLTFRQNIIAKFSNSNRLLKRQTGSARD